MRKLDQWGKIWELMFILAVVNDIVDGKESTAEKILDDYGRLHEYIYSQDLQNFYKTQALLNVRELF